MPDRNQLGRGERERPLVDGQHRGREALGEDERSASLPVGEPEEKRHLARPRERRGEDRVARDHVREDGEGTRRELPVEAREEAARPRRRGAGGEEVDPAVARKGTLDSMVCEHDELVDSGRERAQLRDGGAEDGVARVDGLRREDQAAGRDAHRPAASAASTSARIRPAYSAGVDTQELESAAAAAPRRTASSWSDTIRSIAAASASGSP